MLKSGWWIVLGIVFLFTLAAGFTVWYTPLEADDLNRRVAHVLQIASVGVALLTAIVAIGVSDPPKKPVRVKIEVSSRDAEDRKASKEKVHYKLDEPTEQHHTPGETHQVNFKITNCSGFDLEDPVLTFRLPQDKRYRHNEFGLTFTSNLFNSQQDLRLLEFEETLVLSNSNLPYWNQDASYTIWIRMAFDAGTPPFKVEICVNSANAKGTTEKVYIDPKKLLT